MKTLIKSGAICAAFSLISSAAQALEILHVGQADSADYSSFIEAQYPGSTWVHKPSGLTAANTIGGDLDRVADFDVVGTHGGTGITVKSYLESFDLIIIGNNVSSGNFVHATSAADWAGLTKPVLFHASLIARATGPRPSMFGPLATSDNNATLTFNVPDDTVRVSATALSDAIFEGVTTATDLYDSALRTNTETISVVGTFGGGEHISSLAGTITAVAATPRGIVFWNEGTQNGIGGVLAAKRAYLPLANAANSSSYLTADGKIVLKNLIDELLVTSTPVFLPPTNLVAKSASGLTINLTWTASAGAVSYNIKRAETPTGPYTQLVTTPGTVTSTSYADTGLTEGTTYYYVVSGVNSSATESGNSNEANAPAVATVLPGIDILYVASGNNVVYENLATNGQFASNTWTQKNGGTTGNDVVGGDLTRAAEFTGVNGTTVGAPITVTDYLNSFDLVIIGTPTTSSNYIDTAEGAHWAGLTVPILVHSPFAARALAGRMGLFSGDNTVHPFTFVNANESLRVSTSALSDAILAGVVDVTNLYVATQSDTINGLVRAPNAFGNGEEITRLSNGTVESRGIVFWAAGATLPIIPPAGLPISSNRAFLPFSGGPADLNADGQKVLANLIKQLRVTQTVPPALLTFPPTVLAEEVTGDVYVSWGDAINAVTYNVKRSTISGGPYTPIATGVAGVDFLDENVTAGTTYYYVISSFSTTAAESPDSDEATVILAAGSDYLTWIQTYAAELAIEADRLPGADPDNDGSTNLIEFALKGNPADPSDNGAIASLIQDSSLTLVIAVRDGATFAGGPSADVGGINYTVEGSLGLTFPDSAVTSAGPTDSAPPATGLPDLTGSEWEYHTFKLEASAGLPGKGFLRLKVTQP